LATISPQKRDKVINDLCAIAPTWLFETWAELDGKPIVLEDFQIRYMLDQSAFKITNKTRQAGGSMQVSMMKMHTAMTTYNYRCDIVSINLKEAADKIKYIRMFYESLPKKWRVPLFADNQLSIAFHQKPGQTSWINSLAASAGVRGGKKDIVFDEFAHIMLAEDLFWAAAPAIINGDGKLDVISTPRGNQNLFAQIWMNQVNERGRKPHDLFSRHMFAWWDVRRFVTDYDAVQRAWKEEYHENVEAINIFMPEMVERFGNERIKWFYDLYPYKMFLQEFCCSLNDDANAFFPWELIRKCMKGSLERADDEVDEEAVVPWVVRPEGNENQVCMGVDFGESDEHTDKTSIQVVERLPNQRLMHRYSEVLSKEDYPDFPSQAAHIVEVANRLGVNRLMGDGTGLGRGTMPMIRTHNPSFAVEDINFNPKTKEEMVMKVKSLMEHNKLWLQAEDTVLHAQINNIQRNILPSGTIQYSGKPHDDMFWALALAVRATSYDSFIIYSIG
jgi:phage FluMu gp28-like protein